MPVAGTARISSTRRVCRVEREAVHIVTPEPESAFRSSTKAIAAPLETLDGIAEEILFVSGPLLVGAVVRFAPPAAALALCALLVWAGTLAFVLSPAVAGVRPAVTKPTARPGHRFRGGPALLQPVVVAAGVGLSVGAVELLVMAFAAQSHHGNDVVAWVLAALSLGSALGGVLNGAVDWRTPARVRLPLLAGGLGLALLGAGLAPGLGTLTVAVACAGFFVAPALTTSYLIADEAAPPGRRTQAGAWVNTAVNAGSSGGTAGVGLLVGHLPLGLCFALSGTVAVAAGLLSVRQAGPRRGRARGTRRSVTAYPAAPADAPRSAAATCAAPPGPPGTAGP